MSNELKKEVEAQQVYVEGNVLVKDDYERNGSGGVSVNVRCVITNDRTGKTLSIFHNDTMITIPFEPIKSYLM